MSTKGACRSAVLLCAVIVLGHWFGAVVRHHGASYGHGSTCSGLRLGRSSQGCRGEEGGSDERADRGHDNELQKDECNGFDEPSRHGRGRVNREEEHIARVRHRTVAIRRQRECTGQSSRGG